MSTTALFEGIASFFEFVLVTPMDGIRHLENANWFLANFANWIFVIIGFIALAYWLKQLKIFQEEGNEDYSSTCHSFFE